MAEQAEDWRLSMSGPPAPKQESAALSLASWKGPGFRQSVRTGVPGCGGGGVMFARLIGQVKDVVVVAGFGSCRLR